MSVTYNRTTSAGAGIAGKPGAETVKAAAATMKLSEKIIDETYSIETGMMSYDGQFDPQALEVIRSSLKDLGILDVVPATSALYNGKFVPVRIN